MVIEVDGEFSVFSQQAGETVARIVPWSRIADEADAQFIVRACNSHEDLLAACMAALLQSDESLAEYGGFRLPAAQRIYDMVSAAIAKAEGR